ncbi:MAG: ACT domain-containing protein [Candidatus Bathyarchaeia archaeon]
MVKKRAVVKFGGAELRSGEFFKQAAEMIKAAGFEEVAVVVSAMGKTTDSLINYVKGVGKSVRQIMLILFRWGRGLAPEYSVQPLSTGRNSITVFVEIKDKKALLLRLCQVGEFKGVSLKEKIGAIEVLSPEFIECPGWVAKISEALAEKGINIVEISSSKATITFFWKKMTWKKALEAIKTISD